MPTRVTNDPADDLGKNINRICPQRFHDATQNHCAHFVAHMGDYHFGFLCHQISGSGSNGVSVRVQELFPHCPQVGEWDDLPETDDDLLIFITARRHVDLDAKTIVNVPKKHIGILRDGHIFHYSNSQDEVVRQTPDQVRTRFRSTYGDPTVDLFFGTLPAAMRALRGRATRRRARGAGGLRLKLTRKTYTTSSTIGELVLDGAFECFVLEDPVRPAKIAGITAIPAGTYDIEITHSPKFGRELPLLKNVPGFEGIRIHPGNSPADTEGCLLPGKSEAADFVGDSRAAFRVLFDKIRAAEQRGQPVRIEIVEGGTSPFTHSRSRAAAPAGGQLYRVTADPLNLRSSASAKSRKNLIGTLDFGEIVTATGKPAPDGWIAVQGHSGDMPLTGFVSYAFLEAVPAAAPRAPRRGRTRGPQADAPAAPAANLFRVTSATANLRSVPAVIDPANVLAALPRGHLVSKLKDSSKAAWWEVSTVMHGATLTGFIHSGLLAPHAVTREPDSGSVVVNERALQMILSFEGMDQPARWPGTQSGISLGHGYDLGYHTHDDFVADWSEFLTADELAKLATAIGKKGTAARDIASRFVGITVTVPEADAVFMRSTLAKIKRWTAGAFPGITALPADAQGALASLVYNRGPGMDGERRREMREVRDIVASTALSTAQKLTQIADSIVSMKRLWPDVLGLRRRRDAEARLVREAA